MFSHSYVVAFVFPQISRHKQSTFCSNSMIGFLKEDGVRPKMEKTVTQHFLCLGKDSTSSDFILQAGKNITIW